VLLAVRGAWTAGRRVNATNFAWRVLTSESYEVLPMHFTSWATGQPNLESEFCVLLYRPHNFNWHDHDCYTVGLYSAVCEIDIA